jgi:hypothetical protein
MKFIANPGDELSYFEVGDNGLLYNAILKYVCGDKGTTMHLRMINTPSRIRMQYLSNII